MTEEVLEEQELPVNPEEVVADTTEAEDPDLGYQVSLDSFSGPLDLLLHLVRKSEVAISDIPIVDIADQFLSVVQNWEDADLELAGDFILMAATLLEIKARSIAPLPEGEEDDEEEDDWIDPRADLVRQLLAFRKTKDAVQWLENLENDRLLLHNRRFNETIPEDPAEADGFDLDNADPYLLFKTWEKILTSIAGHRERTVLYDDVPIEERVKKIEHAMETAKEAQLSWLIAYEETPISRVGVVVASLTAVRKRVMEASQHEQYGPVYLNYLEQDQRPWKSLEPVEESSQEGKKKRRRRPPLFTWRPPEGGEAEVDDELVIIDEPEVKIETDEQKFTRELNESCGVDDILHRVKNLDEHLEKQLQESGVVDSVNGQDAQQEEIADATGKSLIDVAAEQETERQSSALPQGEAESNDDSDEFEDDDDDEFEDDDDDEFEDDDDDEFDDDDDD